MHWKWSKSKADSRRIFGRQIKSYIEVIPDFLWIFLPSQNWNFVIVDNERDRTQIYLLYSFNQVCVLVQTIFNLGQSEASSEKRQRQADHCCVGYHPRNKHWPVSLNDDDDVVSYPTRWSLLFVFGFLWWSSIFQHPGNREIWYSNVLMMMAQVYLVI